MTSNIEQKLAKELSINESQVISVVEMIDEGNTVPFIARYRKERTGGLDDEVLRKLSERLIYIRGLEDKKENVIRLIEEQEKLTEEIRFSILKSETLTEVDDIYRPFKMKKRTRATMAEEKGLKPLAQLVWNGNFKGNFEVEMDKMIDLEKGIDSRETAIKGAMDIISEVISDNAEFRKWIRSYIQREAIIVTKGSSEEPTPYEMYYDYKEPIRNIPPYRILAINRGEKEKVLSVKLDYMVEIVIQYLEGKCIKGNNITDKYIKESVRDSYKRLIYPSIEREIRAQLTEIAEERAIEIFKTNLKSLIMQPPIKDKVVMGFDPGFRTGCKVAVLDKTGKFLEKATVYPIAPRKDIDGTISKLKELVLKEDIDVISLGNGTASRESEEVIALLIKELKEEKGKELYYVIVSEAGASVYSASKLAADEYPNLDVTIRGAISIGRRLQDPLSELVKIDPKSIGVGQYQHDVTAKKLDESLKGTVEDVVNKVGVDLNMATPSLLSYISGINDTVAQNIVSYRDEKGKFNSRKELLKVKRLGQKAFEQCAGFLRVMESKEPLDNTSVHPESYASAKKLVDILGYNKDDFKSGSLKDIEQRAEKFSLEELADNIGIGKLTLVDIIKELKKPGRDPREELPKPMLKTGIMDITQLKIGMLLIGTVRNVSDFGAFVDIGVHQDGLVHKSQMSDTFVKHPLDIVKVGDIINVKVIEIDEKRGRISLTMKM
ncbi:Tex family protein [Clostridium algidicarnis]|uniref:Tex family protein n=1 Tax=Clostridium algidicarnis TaxID=37659 RepID=UPI001626885B|nr:Tex family protein [Clostridium algidicarnis]MBB6630977.1 RNA-binding transcriptional accessory protein [Clostridium algidicarnis]